MDWLLAGLGGGIITAWLIILPHIVGARPKHWRNDYDSRNDKYLHVGRDFRFVCCRPDNRLSAQEISEVT